MTISVLGAVETDAHLVDIAQHCSMHVFGATQHLHVIVDERVLIHLCEHPEEERVR